MFRIPLTIALFAVTGAVAAAQMRPTPAVYEVEAVTAQSPAQPNRAGQQTAALKLNATPVAIKSPAPQNFPEASATATEEESPWNKYGVLIATLALIATIAVRRNRSGR